MTSICCEKLEESKVFYTTLFDLTIDYDSEWFIHLESPDKSFELGLFNPKSEMTPPEFQTRPNGFLLTFVVDSADDVFEIAKKEKFKIVDKPSDTPYGQRRLLLEDPNGALVDVSSLMPNFEY